jgi:hypothetical protein
LFPRPPYGRTVLRDADRDDDKDAGRPGRVRIGRADLRGCGVGVLPFGTFPQKSGTADPYGSSDVVVSNPLRFSGFERTCKQPSDRLSDV